ncbi:uncharacterized protein LOC143191963 [Rhynchophorus ferrugineus]|uniref:uncharacterized protein LOC143191963 n=1 Tax=Rhynchophorus ferrugineus TaxID=354439 RepID=UPI003FCC6715
MEFTQAEVIVDNPFHVSKQLLPRVAAVLSITVGTVNNIAYKMKNKRLDSPKKTRLHTKWVTNLDHLDIGSIRDQIYEIYKNKKIVSLESIHKIIRDMQLFEGYVLLVEKEILSKTV